MTGLVSQSDIIYHLNEKNLMNKKMLETMDFSIVHINSILVKNKLNNNVVATTRTGLSFFMTVLVKDKFKQELQAKTTLNRYAESSSNNIEFSVNYFKFSVKIDESLFNNNLEQAEPLFSKKKQTIEGQYNPIPIDYIY